jgi:hypothetical protein
MKTIAVFSFFFTLEPPPHATEKRRGKTGITHPESLDPESHRATTFPAAFWEQPLLPYLS